MKAVNVSEVIKKLSTEGISNVLRDQGGYLNIAYSMPREDLEKFAQSLIDLGDVDEVYFIIELASE
jgi:hypothetical protein